MAATTALKTVMNRRLCKQGLFCLQNASANAGVSMVLKGRLYDKNRKEMKAASHNASLLQM